MANTLPLQIGYQDDAKGFMGQKYFYGPITVKNTGTEDLTDLSMVIDRFDDRGGGDWHEYFDIYQEPESFSIKANETKFATFVLVPKKASGDTDVSKALLWYPYIRVEDQNGNEYINNSEPASTFFVMAEEAINIKQTFLSKWQINPRRPEFMFSYEFELDTEEGEAQRVTDWYLFFDLPEGAYISSDWLETVKGWLELRSETTQVSNTILTTTGDGSHTIEPGSTLKVDIEIVYPDSSDSYETLNNLALNYMFRTSSSSLRIRGK